MISRAHDKPLPAAASQPLNVRIKVAEQSTNPLLEAARPLLEALAHTPLALDVQAIGQRRQWLVHEVKLFDKVCAALHLRPDYVENARYSLCSAIDEATMQTQWGNGVSASTDWSAEGLASHFGYDRRGGDRVYQIIDQAMRDPYGSCDLLEVLGNILDLGFSGRYRHGADRRIALQTIREAIRETIVAGNRSVVSVEVSSPRMDNRPLRHDGWTDTQVRFVSLQKSHRRFIPSLFAVAVAIAIATGCFAYYLHWRGIHLQTISQTALQVSPLDALFHQIGTRFHSEIVGGTIYVVENPERTALTLGFSDMFKPGESTVHTWVNPLIVAVGEEIAVLPLRAEVTGYTDNLPLNRRTLSNQALSKARAESVKQILLAAGVSPDRVSVEGKGEASPISDNATDQGRAKNRRVVITITEVLRAVNPSPQQSVNR